MSTTSTSSSRSSWSSAWSWRARRRSRGVGGAELVGTLEQYENSYRLCYVRGPEGIVVGLAQQLG
ncbi:hypothetical protein H4W80_000466 [Nonomuraea angiospora]|uniref:VOC domain-containing protein n=1 Tax=Nonomuraea angiospora TaxID=46172 RepID=A0ABR9LPK1_9ACTN|nr:hypothetical protein [Nonomuraea angiospora]